MIYVNDIVLKFISEIRFPVSKKDIELKEFLKIELNKYIIDLNYFINSKDKSLSNNFYKKLQVLIPFIESIVERVVSSLEAYDKADYLKANKTVYDILDEIANKIEFVNMRNHYEYYRIRAVRDEKQVVDRKGIFHVPFNLRKYINTSRYSLHGMPSLYLGTASELCWYESGMPKRYRVSKFEPIKGTELKLIDFSIIPFQLASSVDFDIRNKKTDTIALHENKILEFLVMYPLRLASSISVEDRSSTFIHEYVFPQIVLNWVKNRSDYDGIRYQSVSSHKEAHEWNAYNIVLPIKNINSEGYCEELASKFLISEPRYFSIKEFFESDEKLIKVRDMFNTIQVAVEHEKQYYLHDIMKILFSLISILEDIISEKHDNNETLIRALDGLYLGFSNIIKDKKSFIVLMKKNCHIQSEFDELKVENYYKTLNEFRMSVFTGFYRVSFLKMNNYGGMEKLY